ncbi:hypothetical protein RHSIM_Rhsim09G0146400 [Rhododendron simsii]|uniref:RNase H type-1 domain-containing protein n=1 Tax=Rhododendron simsii TaxID=118357 RepID=A0A834LFV1_RHOSS|nr:hypothetical protein RHSIM_Rhsim09G0146400 [Rhododendron simsii]
MDHLNSAIDGPEFVGKIIFLAWQIWKSRNDWVFNSVPVDPKEAVARAAYGWSEFEGGLGNQEVQRKNEVQVLPSQHWSPPQEGWIKANCDVALKKGSSKAAIAVVLRNHRGAVVDGRSALVLASSASQGEALQFAWPSIYSLQTRLPKLLLKVTAK